MQNIYYISKSEQKLITNKERNTFFKLSTGLLKVSDYEILVVY